MVSHRLKFAPRLGRDRAHRTAMLRNMVTSLIMHERILTTHPKAKYAQRFAERMVAYARDGSLNARRQASAFVKGAAAQQKLFHILGKRYEFRPCGFTRVIQARQRKGDNAPLSYLEFVDRPHEIRPPRLCTPTSWMQLQHMREQNERRQKSQGF